MNNPWKDIKLDDYEKHMSLDFVRQLQTLNCMMKEQFELYPVKSAMVLGVAGGNGLEHVQVDKYDTIYGIDINEEYLSATAKRYGNLSGILKCLQLDIINEVEKLPKAELVIANLLIEYIGYSAFQEVIRHVNPKYLSCAIQVNIDEDKWVLDSPYLHAFDRLDEVHNQIDTSELVKAMKEIGYSLIFEKSVSLPNGKALVRHDFIIESKKETN